MKHLDGAPLRSKAIGSCDIRLIEAEDGFICTVYTYKNLNEPIMLHDDDADAVFARGVAVAKAIEGTNHESVTAPPCCDRQCTRCESHSSDFADGLPCPVCGHESRTRTVERLLEFAADVDQTPEEARAELEADGVDVDGFLDRLNKRLKAKGIDLDKGTQKEPTE